MHSLFLHGRSLLTVPFFCTDVPRSQHNSWHSKGWVYPYKIEASLYPLLLECVAESRAEKCERNVRISVCFLMGS